MTTECHRDESAGVGLWPRVGDNAGDSAGDALFLDPKLAPDVTVRGYCPAVRKTLKPIRAAVEEPLTIGHHYEQLIGLTRHQVFPTVQRASDQDHNYTIEPAAGHHGKTLRPERVGGSYLVDGDIGPTYGCATPLG